MYFNLVMAMVWLAVGMGLLIYHLTHPEYQFGYIWGTNVSAGWLILILAGYNLFRWYSQRALAQERQAMLASAEIRRQRERDEGRPVNPDFDFSDQPAAPPNGPAGPA